MTEGGDAAEQVVKMMLTGGEVSVRLVGSALKNGLAMLFALIKNHKKVFGKTNMVKLLRETRDIRTFTMTPAQFRLFQGAARRFKLLYSAVQDRRNRRALVDVILPATEIERANMIFEKIKFTPEREEPKQPEKEEPVEKKGRRSEPDSRDTRDNSSTRDEKKRTTREKPSIEEMLKEHKAAREQQLRQVPARKKSKFKSKGKAK